MGFKRSGKLSRRQRCRNLCRAVVEHRLVVAFTTLLTVWVLSGEDIKQIAFNKDVDEYFGAVGISCIAIFSVEILLSSVGKQDYFLGFFFFLDVISTASLVLDLPWISEPQNEQGAGSTPGADKGRAARVGARSARVVRVIRLIRIAKLYKAVYESRASKRHNAAQRMRGPGGDDDDEVSHNNESRVGKKLSDLTIRRVIVLVLSMLFFPSFLSPPDDIRSASSAQYGADEVSLKFKKYERGEPGAKAEYQKTLLRYIYYHNWFAGNGDCPANSETGLCPNTYMSHVYWVGIAGQNLELVKEKAQLASLDKAVVDSWAANTSHEDIFNYGDIPPEALAGLSSEWKSCQGALNGEYRYGVSLLKNTIPGTPADWAVPCYSDLRSIERKPYTPLNMALADYNEYHIEFWFDERPFMRESAVLSIVTTLLVCIVLCAAAMMFYNDVNQLVLYPVEEMISKVQAIRDDPLKAIAMAEQAYAKEVAKGPARHVSLHGAPMASSGSLLPSGADPAETRGARWALMKARINKAKRFLACTTTGSTEPMETVILEKTIIKLGSLLALGFGEAGAEIIATNMVGSSYGVNVMVPGQRLECVIGNARIQNFSVATEVLQSRVMTFVNQVAEIVHGVVEEHHGAANKNNGDTFLLVWRCIQKEGMTEEDMARHISKISDMSVLAFTKIIGAIHKSSVLATYRGHPGLQNKLGSKYRVHLTAGLHAGWVIEGAVGSEYKIEASYLSPNVAVAINVEDATQIYNVSFLASEAVVKNCCVGMQQKCRLIDCAMIPGSREPLELFSIDLDFLQVQVEKEQQMRTFGAKLRMHARQFLESEKFQKPNLDISSLFNTDPDIQAMRRYITEDFLELFRMGYVNYAEGEWQVARRFLDETSAMRGSLDGPSCALIRFMETFQFEAPEGWKGIHDLASNLSTGGPGDSAAGAGSFGRTLRYSL